jgi:hypothetical protein
MDEVVSGNDGVGNFLLLPITGLSITGANFFLPGGVPFLPGGMFTPDGLSGTKEIALGEDTIGSTEELPGILRTDPVGALGTGPPIGALGTEPPIGALGTEPPIGALGAKGALEGSGGKVSRNGRFLLLVTASTGEKEE